MRIHGFIIFVVSLFLTTFSAATGTLKGVVKDKSTDQPIANAIVRLIGKGLTDTTDANGNFLFSSFIVPIIAKCPSNNSLIQPHYIPGKGIIFVNKNKGYIRVDIFNLSGKEVAVLNNSVLEQGIWSIPLNTIAKGMYLCRIKSADEMNAFRFMMTETGHQRGMPIKMGDINGSQGMYLSKKEASATTVDTIIASNPGYYSDTLLWNEKRADSVTFFLISSTSNNSEIHFNYLQLYNNLKAIDNFTYCISGYYWDLMNDRVTDIDTAKISIASLSTSQNSLTILLDIRMVRHIKSFYRIRGTDTTFFSDTLINAIDTIKVYNNDSIYYGYSTPIYYWDSAPYSGEILYITNKYIKSNSSIDTININNSSYTVFKDSINQIAIIDGYGIVYNKKFAYESVGVGYGWEGNQELLSITRK